MANVVAVHNVGNFETWLAGDHRARLFKEFCSGYRLYRMPDQKRVALVFEDVDIPKMQSLFESSEGEAAKKDDTVVDPIEVFVEIEGGR